MTTGGYTAVRATLDIFAIGSEGTLTNGVFISDGSGEITVLSAALGEGTFDWNMSAASKKVYQLTHTVRKGGTVDAAGTCSGYLDFTRCVSYASQADVEAAVLGAITHKISVTHDEVWANPGSCEDLA